MGKFKYTLSNIWFWIVIAIGCFIMESVYFFTIPGVSFAHESFWILAIAGFGSSAVYFYLEHKKNGMKFDKIVLPIFVLAFIFFTISLWTQDGEPFQWVNGLGENVVEFSIAEKLRYTVMLGFSMLTAYMILFTHSHNLFSKKKMAWVAIAYMLFTLVNIIISLITEFEVYKNIFGDAENIEIENSLKSIYNNENMFGVIVLVGICACAVVNYAKPNVPTFILMAIFFLWTLIIGSGTCVICALIFVPIYIVIETVRGLKERPIRCCIWMSAVILTVIICIVIFAVGVHNDVEFFVNFEEHLDVIRLEQNAHFDNFTGRIAKWVAYLEYGFDNPWHLLFGRGFDYKAKYLTAIAGALKSEPAGGSISAENGFVELFLHGGLLAVGLYIALSVYFVYCCIYLIMKKRYAFGSLYLLIFVIMTMNNMLETNLFFDLGGKESFITIVFFAPVIASYKQMTIKGGEKLKATKELDIKDEPLNTLTITRTLSLIFIALITVLVSLIPGFIASHNGSILVILFNGIFACISLWLFLPYLVSLWKKDAGTAGFLFQLITNIIFIVGGTAAIGFIFYVIDSTSSYFLFAAQIGLHLILGGYLIVYAFLRKGNFKEYLMNTIIEPLSMCRYAGPSAVVTMCIGTLILSNFYVFTMNTFLTLMIMSLSIFLAVLFLVPNNPKDLLENILNQKDMAITVKYLNRGNKNV